jgi:Zn-dependent M28 family amino/carboxypeptidase
MPVLAPTARRRRSFAGVATLALALAASSGGCAGPDRPAAVDPHAQPGSADVSFAVAERRTESGVVPQGPPPAQVVEVLREIDEERLRGDVDALAAFGTRHTLSDTESPDRGIGAARRWLRDRLEEAAAGAGDAPMTIELERHPIEPDGRRIPRPVEVVNAVAVLPGTMPEARDRRYYVIAHYDSRASEVLDATSDAPGANDDASGTALVLELARVMAPRRWDSTLVFMAVAGEEQGLFGSRRHAERAEREGWDVRGVLSNDIVGDPTAPSGHSYRERVRVFSEALPAAPAPERLAEIRLLGAENDSPSRELARYAARVAALHRTGVRPMPVFRADRFLRGGDHAAFNEQGFPAIRFTEVAENYARQHQDVREEGGVRYGDLPEHVDAGYLAGVARLNAAVLGHLANAPAPPAGARIVVAELTDDTTLRWSRGPEPDLAGYEVVWRPTDTPYWQEARDVGDVTEAVLPLSKDNYFFGVRAYDRDGYRSPVAFPTAARE